MLIRPVGLLLLCLAMGDAASFPTTVSRYMGRWDLVAGESDPIDKAIEATIAPMSFIARPIARGKLKRRNVAFPRFLISMEAAGIRVRHEQGLDVVYPGVGTAVKTLDPDGSSVVSTLSVEPLLKLAYDADAGQREDQYALSENGSKLTMLVRITSAKLPGPLTYRLVYRRAL